MPWTLPERAVLGLFAQRPAPGHALPQLAAEFGPEHAARIHEAMLADNVDLWGSERILSPGGRRVIVFDPPEAGPWFDRHVPESFALQAQVEGDPGARLQEFIQGEIEEGAERVVVLGTNAPALDPSLVISAFLCLEGRDVVLGPSTSGGCYLIGCRGEAPPIFAGIDWGTSQALGQMVDRINETGLTLGVLPPAYTVETPEDWRVLSGHLRAMRRAGIAPGLPRTEAALEATFPRG